MKRASLAAGLSVSALLITASLINTNSALAASSISGNTLNVSPAIASIQLKPGESSVSEQVTLTNKTAVPLKIAFGARDFGALSESGSISFYGQSYRPSSNPHSLQAFVTFPTPSIILAPHAHQSLTVSIPDLSKLAVGGHYGALLFSPASIASASGSNISIRSSVASLLFLVTATGGTQGVQLLPFQPGAIRFSLPTANYLVFTNNGNTQTTLRGQLTLYSPTHRIVSTTVVNTGSGMILPGSSRLFTTNLPLPSKRFAMPGIYHLQLQYRDDSSAHFTTVTKTFVYLNPVLTIPGLIILAALVYGFRLYGKDSLRWARGLRKRA